MHKGLETPDHDVLETDGAIELRRCARHLAVEVVVDGSRRGAAARGFRRLARYIFGGNATGEKIAMTAPVTQAPADGHEGRWHVRFVVPAAYSRYILPAPHDAAVQVVEVSPQTQAVIRFSGRWSDRRLAAKADALRRWGMARGLKLSEPPRFQFYDDPFTLPFRRRNEVAFALRDPET